MFAVLALFFFLAKRNTRGLQVNYHLSYVLSQLDLIIFLSIILKPLCPSALYVSCVGMVTQHIISSVLIL